MIWRVLIIIQPFGVQMAESPGHDKFSKTLLAIWRTGGGLAFKSNMSAFFCSLNSSLES